jgi:hypothetical protein
MLTTRFDDAVAYALGAHDSQRRKGTEVPYRKKRCLAAIGSCSDSALLVSLADKVYNARWIVEDLRLLGPSMLDRFGADEPKDQSILWYYRSLVFAYGGRPSAPRRLLGELDRAVDELGRLIGPPPCPTCASTNVVEIIWGFPGADIDSRMAGRAFEFGGCTIDPDHCPDFRCADCNAEWADQQYDRE